MGDQPAWKEIAERLALIIRTTDSMKEIGGRDHTHVGLFERSNPLPNIHIFPAPQTASQTRYVGGPEHILHRFILRYAVPYTDNIDYGKLSHFADAVRSMFRKPNHRLPVGTQGDLANVITSKFTGASDPRRILGVYAYLDVFVDVPYRRTT